MSLPSDSTAAEVHAPLFDFSKTPLAREHTGDYVKVLDNVFTPEECQHFIRLAESDSKWKQAAVHYGLGPSENYVNTDYRNSERILRFDKDAAEFLYQRLLPYISELKVIKPGGEWYNVVGSKTNPTGIWKLNGVNERLSFLRYGPGHYFKGHCDGQIELPDGRKSRVTIQIYLNGDSESLQGGATRIMSTNGKRYVDIEPRLGRVLVFQQRGVWHSGEEVTKGLKYALRSDLLFLHGLEDDSEDDDVLETETRRGKAVLPEVRQGLMDSIKNAFSSRK